MLLDIPTAPDVMTIREAARRLGVQKEAVFEYIVKGIKGVSGEMIRLEGGKFGGRWLTTESRVEAWLQAIVSVTPLPRNADLDMKRRAERATKNVMKMLGRGANGRR